MQTLKELRMAAGLTQMDVAARLGTTPAKVSAWEVGRVVPPTRVLAELAKTLGVDADALLEAIDATPKYDGTDRRKAQSSRRGSRTRT
jgi:transcriptional regulator with XRE-family HTH domain